MAFEQEIKQFQTNGTFSYQFDEAGNLILNPSSSILQQHYVSLDLVDYNYDTVKINSFYDVQFREFVKTEVTSSGDMLPQDMLDQINLVTQQNTELQGQLDQLIAQSQVSSAGADELAIKDIIVTLRIQLGQGSNELDFDDAFPYLPIPLDQRDSAPTT